MFVDYSNQLRARYPDHTIRNATVFAAAISEFARLGYIELVDARKIPKDIPEGLVRTVKRARGPIWIPGKNFPDEPLELYERLKPSLLNGKVVWKHTPSKRPATWRTRPAK